MKEILQAVADRAKANLKRDGYLAPVIIWYRNGQQVIEPQLMPDYKDLNAEDAKTQATFVAGIMAKKFNADLLVFIWDAAFRMLAQDEKIDATEGPLTYPKTMRTECIIINGISLPSGKDGTIIVPYKGGDKEPVEFLPNTFPEGMDLESRFTELALEGWNKAETLF